MTEKSEEPSATQKRAKRSKKSKSRGGRRSGAGRPVFRPSIEQRQTVEEMKFCGDSDEVIARAIGIDPDTLRKHFVDELADGYAQRRKEIVLMLFREARSGNASALRRLEEIGRLALAADGSGGNNVPTAKIGKKKQQQAAAEGVGGIFSPPPAPRLVVSNA